MTIGSFILWMIAIAFAIAWLKQMDRRFPLVTRVVWTLLIGFTAGFLARFLIPGAGIPSFGTTALLGIAGAAVGGLIGSRLAGSRDHRLGWAGAVTAVIGSVILLWVSFGLAR